MTALKTENGETQWSHASFFTTMNNKSIKYHVQQLMIHASKAGEFCVSEENNVVYITMDFRPVRPREGRSLKTTPVTAKSERAFSDSRKSKRASKSASKPVKADIDKEARRLAQVRAELQAIERSMETLDNTWQTYCQSLCHGDLRPDRKETLAYYSKEGFLAPQERMFSYGEGDDEERRLSEERDSHFQRLSSALPSNDEDEDEVHGDVRLIRRTASQEAILRAELDAQLEVYMCHPSSQDWRAFSQAPDEDDDVVVIRRPEEATVPASTCTL